MSTTTCTARQQRHKTVRMKSACNCKDADRGTDTERVRGSWRMSSCVRNGFTGPVLHNRAYVHQQRRAPSSDCPKRGMKLLRDLPRRRTAFTRMSNSSSSLKGPLSRVSVLPHSAAAEHADTFDTPSVTQSMKGNRTLTGHFEAEFLGERPGARAAAARRACAVTHSTPTTQCQPANWLKACQEEITNDDDARRDLGHAR